MGGRGVFFVNVFFGFYFLFSIRAANFFIFRKRQTLHLAV
jgi:hypothetical protein